jgi:hypothetical protein
MRPTNAGDDVALIEAMSMERDRFAYSAPGKTSW